MKAQMVKNAVIVPVGSKGGFVLKHPPADRQELRDEVVRQYTTLMSGMLDITDNLVAGEVVQPAGVRILDGDDPYLVVAADKGTASLSDTANAISESYGFWLGDAFASGGSAGYDHKKLGITARGAWESVKRHFRELGLERRHRAVHRRRHRRHVGRRVRQRHAALRPDPAGGRVRPPPRVPRPRPRPGASDSPSARRLFDLPGSSWDDYDRSKISAGGGVFGLDAKSVPLGPEVRAALGLDESVTALPPAELMTAILRAPGRPVLERRHRHVREGLRRVARRGRRPHQRRASASTAATCASASSARAATSASRSAAASSTPRPAGASTPTPSTTRPASTAPTTRSTSRSCSASPRPPAT